MTTNQRIILAALVPLVHMILQCSGETTISHRENYNTKPQQNKPNIANQVSATTTLLSVSPYIFSVDDYDTLQDAESLQQALSIVAYEPQKIDQKLSKKKSNISKTIDTFEKTTQPYYTTTLLPIERKYYEVPRKQSNIKVHSKQENESMKSSRSKLVQETSLPTRAPEKLRENSWQHETYHHHNDSLIQATSPRTFAKNNHKTLSSLPSLPFNYSLIEKTSIQPFSALQSNYSGTLKYDDNKIDQTGSETSKTEVDASKVKKNQRKIEYVQPQQNNNYYQLFQPTGLASVNDRIPRPFSLPAECNPVAQPLTYQTRTTSIRQNAPNYPTAYLRQNLSPPTIPVEPSAASSILAKRHNIRPTIPTNAETLPYSKNLLNPERASPYSRVSAKPEQTALHLKAPLRRNSDLKNVAKQQADSYSPFLVELPIPRSTHSTQQATHEQPSIYSYTRRPENLTSRSGSLSKQYRGIVRSNNIPKIEEIHSTVATRENQVTTNSNTLPKQDSTIRYQTIPRRRKVVNHNVGNHQTEIHSSEPVKQTIAQPTHISKQKVVPLEQNLGHPTIVQPTYTWLNKESTNQDKDTKADSSKYDNSDDKDYSTSENYSNSNENNSNNDDNNNDNDDDDSSKNDNKSYSYNYNERYEEPIDEQPKKHTHAYEVREENTDEPELQSQKIKIDTSNHQESQKKADPVDYDQDHPQYIDFPSSEQDPDYDQARGQNTQHEIANSQPTQHLKDNKEDLVEEADHHHKKHHKPESHDDSEGHSAEGHEDEHHEHGEKGHKDYKQFHEHDKAEKGFHDKEGHNHHYDEKKGKDKKHHEAAGFHEEGEKGEEGEKKSAFKEKAKHEKGHSTKGEHVIHKKDEFEKKTEFFDEFHEGGDIDKDGGFHTEHHHTKGGHHKKSHHQEGENEKKHGEKGKYDKGHHHHESKGHDEHEGHEQHQHHEERHGKKGGHEDAKKWSHKKGRR